MISTELVTGQAYRQTACQWRKRRTGFVPTFAGPCAVVAASLAGDAFGQCLQYEGDVVLFGILRAKAFANAPAVPSVDILDEFDLSAACPLLPSGVICDRNGTVSATAFATNAGHTGDSGANATGTMRAAVDERTIDLFFELAGQMDVFAEDTNNECCPDPRCMGPLCCAEDSTFGRARAQILAGPTWVITVPFTVNGECRMFGQITLDATSEGCKTLESGGDATGTWQIDTEGPFGDCAAFASGSLSEDGTLGVSWQCTILPDNYQIVASFSSFPGISVAANACNPMDADTCLQDDKFHILLSFLQPCGCADINGDGIVNVLDLVDLLLIFGQSCPAPPALCPEDINCDGTVDVLDLTILLTQFGFPCD